MKSINSLRVKSLNEKPVSDAGDYVLYWMQANRRVYSHFGLQYAVAYANRLKKPLLVFEALRSDYPWASARFHTFILEGMAEHLADSVSRGWNYFPFVETSAGEGRGLMRALSARACVVISDWFPAFIFPEQNRRAAESCPVSYLVVDSNGILPMALSVKPAYSAFIFRRTIMQRHFLDCWKLAPEPDPLSALQNRESIDLSHIFARWTPAWGVLNTIATSVANLPIDQSVLPVSFPGTRAQALARLNRFLNEKLSVYATRRNQPDDAAFSGLSPYLHFGKISAHEVADAVLAKQPAGWTPDHITYAAGQNRGFFNGDENIESFMDEFVTWREIGYHFCNLVPHFDSFDSLPDWVKITFSEHDSDPRIHVYTEEELENSRTHDEIWNAAQNQLRTEGVIHNYLRMLWGKKILEWSPDAKTAMERMIHLNNKYSIDGRNPNSYTGIFWVLGRFDRPWAPARPVFGTVRFMSSDSTRKKISLKNYLNIYGQKPSQGDLGF